MAGETTALITFAQRSVFEEIHGPAGSRIWRPGYLAALVEKHIPVWVITPIAHAAHSKPRHQIVVSNPDIEGPLEMDLMPMMASLFDQGNRELKAQGEQEGLLHSAGNRWWINSKSRESDIDEEFDGSSEAVDRFQQTEDRFPSGKIYELSFPIVADRCRVTILRYPNSLLSSSGDIWLRSIGCDVDVFTLNRYLHTDEEGK